MLVLHANENGVVVPAAAGGVKGRRLHKGPGAVRDLKIFGAGSTFGVFHKVFQAFSVGVLQTGMLSLVCTAVEEQLLGRIKVKCLVDGIAIGILIGHIAGRNFFVLIQNGTSAAGFHLCGRNRNTNPQHEGSCHEGAEHSLISFHVISSF